MALPHTWCVDQSYEHYTAANSSHALERNLHRSLTCHISGWLTRQKDTGEQSVRKEALEIEGGQTYAVKTDIGVVS